MTFSADFLTRIRRLAAKKADEVFARVQEEAEGGRDSVQEQRARAESSLIEFVKLTWPVLEPTREFVDGWAIRAVVEHLEAVARGQIRRLLINISPGSSKSLLTNVFLPAWIWGPQNRPSTRFMSASYAEKLTIRDNRRCRFVVESPIYRQFWGSRFELAGDQNAKVRFDTDKMGFKIATSVGGVATGERADMVVIDDPHSVMEAESDAVREATLQWFAEVMPT